MSRQPLHTVTFPILVGSGRKEPHGEVAITRSGRHGIVKVCEVPVKELIGKSGPVLGDSLELFRGLERLKRAFEGKDELKLMEAVQMLHPYDPPLPSGMTTTMDWSGNKKWVGARWEYLEHMTRQISGARFVMWFRYGESVLQSPAIYCRSLKTAAFVALSRDGVRVCPKCGALYVPDKLTQGYCTPKHGVAFRTARSRERKSH
jgi:hypothetical protein